DLEFLHKKSIEIRLQIVKMIYKAKSGHIGGSLSCTDILVALFYKVLKPEDKFILSKGHSVEAYYAILADKGYFPNELLDSYCQFGTKLIGHPSTDVPGIEIATGSLGHGLAIGCGMALGFKRDRIDGRVYVLMGDGELQEGSIWESVMFASTYNLDNLIGIIDRNRLQIAGDTEKVIKLEPLKERWEAFGWEIKEVDGHNIEEIINVLSSIELNKKPHLIIAHTIKGKGISFIENNYKWHHGILSKEQFERAIEELSEKLEVKR
ncbi:MAG: transketolase, partial [Dictyoglomaceae bacterium]|nr:transketolase [Dictyoglomaceae bacterium]